jgi:hypothetical protein
MTHSNRWPLFAGATTVVTAGLLAAPVPAHADRILPLAPPACLQWGFAGPTQIVANGNTIVNFDATGPSFSGTSSSSAVPNIPTSGSIDANKFISISLSMPGPPPATETYNGVVGDDGIPHGKSSNTSPIVQGSVDWTTAAPLKCAKEAAVEAPKQGPTVSPDPGLTGVTFHITDRSGVASQCTYSSEGFQSSFGLPANGSFDLDVPAIRQFKNRTGTVTCDNGTSTNTSVFF